MNSSVLLQTETLCVPTQLVFIDLTSDSRVKHYLSNANDESGSEPLIWVDTITHPIQKTLEEEEESDVASLKRDYVKLRPRLLAQFNSLYDHRVQQGSKGRLVVWFVADISDGPMASLLLRELPLDLSNSCRWRHKYVPGIIRVSISPNTEAQLGFLRPIGSQYFEMKSLVNDGFANSKSRSNLEQLVQEQLGGAVATAESDDKARLMETVELGSNPFDITIVAESFETELVPRLLSKILKLHQHETKFSVATENISHEVGVGAHLFIIADQLVASMSIWRRLDWLVLAQTQFCPRLWNISDTKRAEELLSILDYRCWLSRFSGVEDLFGEGLIDFPDSSWDEIKGNLAAGATGSFNRRRREVGWTEQLLHAALNLPKPETNSVDGSSFDPLLEEANEWRITETDFSSWQELLICLQRTKNYKKSLEVIGKYLRGKSRIPPVFEKLEALALLKVDQNHEQRARDMLKRYRQRLLSSFQDELLLKGEKGTESQQGQVYSEIAAVALVDGSAAEAQEYARKALEKDKSIAGAYKTLIWASVRTGVTSLEQEDLIFTFFVSYLRDPAKANEYYSICVKKHPQVGIYKYAYAIFLQFIVGELDQAAEQYKAAKELLKDNSRFLETYSTFLTQTELFKDETESGKFSQRKMALFQEIEAMYRKALSLDAENIVIKGNLAAFLLASATRIASASQEAVQKMQIEAFRLLDSVLYGSGDLNSKNAALALELWFYTVCYTTQEAKRSEAMRHVKALLRRQVRSPGWDLSMHLQSVRKNSLSQSQAAWIDRLADVVTMKESVTTLRNWPLWQQASAERLARSPVKNSTGVASVNIGSVIKPVQDLPAPSEAPKPAALKLPGNMLAKTYSKPSLRKLASSSSSISASSDKSSEGGADSQQSAADSAAAVPDVNTSIDDDSALFETANSVPAAPTLSIVEMPSLSKQSSTGVFDIALDSTDSIQIEERSEVASLSSMASLRRRSLLIPQQNQINPRMPSPSKPQAITAASSSTSAEPPVKKQKLTEVSQASWAPPSSAPPTTANRPVQKNIKTYAKKK